MAPRYDGLDAEEIRRRTGAARVELRGSVGSALDVAHELAAAGAPHGLLVLADAQTAGRGRQGRSWHSPAGAGAWVVALLRPAEAPSAGALAIRVGLRLVEAVAEIAPRARPRLKWPNDLIVRHRKAGGVLCEARWQGEKLGWIAVGIGVNVRGPLAPALRHSAIALKAAEATVTRVRLLEALVPRLWDAATPPALDAAEQDAFLRLRWHEDGASDAHAGALGVDENGALLVPRPDGSLDRRTVPA
ncbi:MAG TPA: biotin--[acetyl-CoA-carboxylase] ligase [Gemmatimonadales bacterium]|nr:biotin--[acetyl-CoA-carboxylase] ligase [Gemmatimonadales bacterium]